MQKFERLFRFYGFTVSYLFIFIYFELDKRKEYEDYKENKDSFKDCFVCGQKGHISKNCPKKDQPTKGNDEEPVRQSKDEKVREKTQEKSEEELEKIRKEREERRKLKEKERQERYERQERKPKYKVIFHLTRLKIGFSFPDRMHMK